MVSPSNNQINNKTFLFKLPLISPSASEILSQQGNLLGIYHKYKKARVDNVINVLFSFVNRWRSSAHLWFDPILVHGQFFLNTAFI